MTEQWLGTNAQYYEPARDFDGPHNLPHRSTVLSMLIPDGTCLEAGGVRGPKYELADYLDLCPETAAYNILQDIVGEPDLMIAGSEDAFDPRKPVMARLISVISHRVTDPDNTGSFTLKKSEQNFIENLVAHVQGSTDLSAAAVLLDSILTADEQA